MALGPVGVTWGQRSRSVGSWKGMEGGWDDFHRSKVERRPLLREEKIHPVWGDLLAPTSTDSEPAMARLGCGGEDFTETELYIVCLQVPHEQNILSSSSPSALSLSFKHQLPLRPPCLIFGDPAALPVFPQDFLRQSYNGDPSPAAGLHAGFVGQSAEKSNSSFQKLVVCVCVRAEAYC